MGAWTMHLRSLFSSFFAGAALLGAGAPAAEPAPLLSIRPTLFTQSEDLGQAALTSTAHLGVTGRTRELAPGLTAELELSLDLNDDLNPSDNSSFLRLAWRPASWAEGEGLSVTVLPFHSDRLYLGYEYPLTDLAGTYPRLTGPRPLAPGLSLRFTRGPGYAFAAVKSQPMLNELVLESERQYTFLVGAGAEVLPFLRVEAEGSHAELGTVPGLANQGILQRASAWGGAGRLLFHRGAPIGPPTDVERIQNDPARWERLFAPQAYDEGLASSVSAELLYLSQGGLEGDVFRQPSTETSLGAAAEGRVRWRKLRGYLRGQYRAASLLWADLPGFPPYRSLSTQVAATHGELTATLAADYHFVRTRLTPGLSVQVRRPAWVEQSTEAGLTPRNLVFPPGHGVEVLPLGDRPLLEWRAAATLRWELGQLSALGEAFLRRDPNRTVFRDAGASTEPSYDPLTAAGFDVMVQLCF